MFVCLPIAIVSIAIGLPGPPDARDGQGALFVGLGDLPGGFHASIALDISADGRVVVGHGSTASGGRAFRWENGRLEAIAGPASVAHGVSADGSIVVGTWSATPSSIKRIRVIPDGSRPFRWVRGALDVIDTTSPAEAVAISADGQVLIGQSQAGDAWMWRGGKVSALEVPAGFGRLLVRGLSPDGQIVVGGAAGPSGTGACRTPPASILPCLPGGGAWSEARAVSAGGIAAGASDSWWGVEACVWRGEEPIGLGGLSVDHEIFSYAADLSNDGSVVVGASEDDAGLLEAFIWRTHQGMRGLRRALLEELGLTLDGWTLAEATAVSSDGRTIVGYGRNPDGDTEGWLARWPADPCPTVPDPTVPDPAGPRAHGLAFTKSIAELAGFDDLRDVTFDDQGAILIAAAGDIWRLSGPKWKPHLLARDIHQLRAVAAADGARVYVAAGDEIRVLLGDGRLVARWTTSTGDAARLLAPQDIAVDGDRVAVADTGNDRVVIFDGTGALRTLIGGRGWGPETFRRPTAVAWGAEDELLIVDSDNHRVQRFDVHGRLLGTWGDRGHWRGAFSEPLGAAWHSGLLYVSDAGNHRVQGFDADGNVQVIFGGRGAVGAAGLGRFHGPSALAIARDGSVAAVCEPLEGRIQLLEPCSVATAIDPHSPRLGEAVDIRGGFVAIVNADQHTVEVRSLNDPDGALRIGGFGDRPGLLNRPAGVALDPQRQRLLVCDRGNRRLVVFELVGRPPREVRFARALDFGGIAAARGPIEPLDVAIADDGTAYVLNRLGGSIWKIDPGIEQAIPLPAAARAGEPRGLALDGARHRLYVLDGDPNRLTELDLDGGLIATWPIPVDVTWPCAIAALPGQVLLLDRSGGGIVCLPPNGQWAEPWAGAATGRFAQPTDLACDADGRMAVFAAAHECVHVLATDGSLLDAFGAPFGVRAARAGWRAQPRATRSGAATPTGPSPDAPSK